MDVNEILKKQVVFGDSITKKFKVFLLSLFPKKYRVMLLYKNAFGYWPNLSQPKSFNEKIAVYKLNITPTMVNCADKILAKKYIEEKIGDDLLIPTLYTGTSIPSQEEINKLPDSFVIKASHGSSWNLFINKKSADWKNIKVIVDKWINTKYGKATSEDHYAMMKPAILIEPHLTSGDALPNDYKVFVFNGKPMYIQVDVGRDRMHERDIFDADWNKLPIKLEHPNVSGGVKKPKVLKEMLEVAVKIAKDFSFARVDFYEIDGTLFFGEITFFPGGGIEKFSPTEWDIKFGNLWR